MATPSERLINLCQKKELGIALAESMTCGLVSAQLATVRGASDVFKGAIVCYSPEVKCGLLGVDKELIRKYTAESPQVTEALAEKLKRRIKADVYAAVTGLASSDGTETKQKPVGTVYFAILFRGKLKTLRRVFRGKPSEIKKKAVDALIRFVFNTLKEAG
jgi:nicotinamide-nucleotide amidase